MNNIIIPKPLSYIEKNGYKLITYNSMVLVSEKLKEYIPILQKMLKSAKIEIDKNNFTCNPTYSSYFDFFVYYDGEMEEEEYAINCSPDCVNIYTSSSAGIIYALKTITQIKKKGEKSSSAKIPCCEILDKPRFKHRGLHLDVARHFFDVKDICKLLDLMCLYKLNVLHLHLTDDQGWRIQIDKYPLLTEIGSKRSQSQEGAWCKAKMDGKEYSGFYTKADIKKIIKFAQSRNITVIPEIDIPAHCGAAIAVYKTLACKEIDTQVPMWFCDEGAKECGHEYWNRPLCAGKDSTYQFIFNVLDEICELFPSPYIHIGGDEAPKDEWINCPHCKKKMDDEHITSAESLQGYFTNQIEEYLCSKGKSAIVWNDALRAKNINHSIICQYWTEGKDPNVLEHIKSGGQVIISKLENLYFDMPYSKTPLINTFNLYPTFMMIPPKYESSILGIEGTVWTEWIKDTDKLEFQLYPRLLALSETCWRSKGYKSFEEFLSRWDIHKKVLEVCGINYAEDEISMPRGKNQMESTQRTWSTTDSDCEFKKNKKLKSKN